jgi:hypothetical protein
LFYAGESITLYHLFLLQWEFISQKYQQQGCLPSFFILARNYLFFLLYVAKPDLTLILDFSITSVWLYASKQRQLLIDDIWPSLIVWTAMYKECTRWKVKHVTDFLALCSSILHLIHCHLQKCVVFWNSATLIDRRCQYKEC